MSFSANKIDEILEKYKNKSHLKQQDRVRNLWRIFELFALIYNIICLFLDTSSALQTLESVIFWRQQFSQIVCSHVWSLAEHSIGQAADH